MATFPILSTGAVMQYPALLTLDRPVQVIRFLDGSDQRFPARGRLLRSWEIRLALLNEAELQQVEAFFQAQAGEYSLFDFPDPFSGTTVPNCRMGSPAIATLYEGTDIGAASFVVNETNG